MDLQNLSEQIKSLDVKIWAAIIPAVAALIVALFNFHIQKKTLKLQAFTLASSISEKKMNRYTRQLEEFYYPIKTYLSESARLYTIFRNGLPEDFRAVPYLIDNNYLFEEPSGKKVAVRISPKKMKILSEIMEIEDKVCDLIILKGGIIEDEALSDIYTPNKNMTDVVLNFDPNRPKDLPNNISLLSLFMVHCKIMKLAFEGELDKENVEIYNNFVYPRELNYKLDENINKIKEQIAVLRNEK